LSRPEHSLTQEKHMQLILNSLNSPRVIVDNITSLHAEDQSGHFGIHPGHTDFLTVIDTNIVEWLTFDNKEQYCAVRCGVLRVSSGTMIMITSREIMLSDNLAHLESVVLAEFRQRDEVESTLRTESRQLELQVLREMMSYLHPQASFNYGQRISEK
jgi:F-type H+-transporting ATPase subunit epsilon